MHSRMDTQWTAARTFPRTYARVDRRTGVQTHYCVDARLQGQMDAQMHGCMDGLMPGHGDAQWMAAQTL